MNQNQRPVKLMAAAVLFLGFLIGCAGSDSSTSSDSDSSATQISNLGDLPSLDLSDYDYSDTENNTVSAKLGGLKVATKSEGDFSRAGCETLALKAEAIRFSKELQMFNCYITQVHAQSEGEVDFDDNGDWKYLHLIFSDEADAGQSQGHGEGPEGEHDEGPPAQVYTRFKKSGDQISMDACNEEDDGDLRKDVEVRYTTGDAISGTIVNQFVGSDDQGNTFEDKLQIEALFEPSTENADELVATFSMNFLGAWGNGVLSFSADPATLTNVISGGHSAEYEGNEFTNRMVSRFGINDDGSVLGSARVSFNASFPAPDAQQCQQWGVPEEHLNSCVDKCYDHEGNQTAAVDGACPFEGEITESYSIADGESTLPDVTIIANSASPFADAVADATLPDPSTATVSFQDSWDCTGDYLEVDVTDYDFSTCEAIMEESEALNNLFDYCHSQDNQDINEDLGE